MIELTERLAGGVWGHLVGDALGVPYEFALPSAISSVEWGHSGTYGQPPGTWSDDGGLMLALLDSLLTVGFDVEDRGRRALAWMNGPDYKPGPRFDIGTGTSEALSALSAGRPAELAGGTSEKNNGNGSLMRILPIALVGRELPRGLLAQQATRASSLTHRHPRSQLVCALYVLIAQELLRGETNLPAAMASAQATLPTLIEETHAVELASIMAFEPRTGSGYVVDSFWSAWAALCVASNYREAVTRAISYGNDTDTSAAVAGGLAGILWGLGGIPSEWLYAMRGQEIVSSLVTRLIARAIQT